MTYKWGHCRQREECGPKEASKDVLSHFASRGCSSGGVRWSECWGQRVGLPFRGSTLEDFWLIRVRLCGLLELVCCHKRQETS